MTRIPGTTWRPGPPQKAGYPTKQSRTLAEIQGEIKHSMEGSLAAALGELDNPARQASWTLSVPLTGAPLQHYELEAVTWHGGSQNANVKYIGIEHEGKAGTPLNAHQTAVTTELSRQIRLLCPAVAANPPQRQVNLWEHRELSSTACPSNRIPWDTIIAGLTAPAIEEVDMFIIRLSTGKAYVVGPAGKRYIDDTEEYGIYKDIAKVPVYQFTAAQDRAIDTIPDIGTGGGPSEFNITLTGKAKP